MYITRYKINNIRNKLKKYLLNVKKNKKNKLYRIAYFICRSKKINIDFDRNLIYNIEFIYDNINKHWAETDGIKIYINSYIKYNKKTLYYTIKHEMIHGMIKRNNNHELSEHLEHKLMYLLDKKLI